MPRAPKPPKPVDPLKPPPRAVCDAICRRFLKTTQNIEWRREMPQFYNLWKQYPSLPFWQGYELPFGNNRLNHMSWFISVEGKAELERAWVLFNYHPVQSVPPPIQSSLDNAPQGVQDKGDKDGGYAASSLPPPPPPITSTRPRTVAEMMRG